MKVKVTCIMMMLAGASLISCRENEIIEKNSSVLPERIFKQESQEEPSYQLKDGINDTVKSGVPKDPDPWNNV